MILNNLMSHWILMTKCNLYFKLLILTEGVDLVWIFFYWFQVHIRKTPVSLKRICGLKVLITKTFNAQKECIYLSVKHILRTGTCQKSYIRLMSSGALISGDLASYLDEFGVNLSVSWDSTGISVTSMKDLKGNWQ